MPAEEAVVRCEWFSGEGREPPLAAGLGVSGVIVTHHLGNRTSMSFAGIVSDSPVDDHRQFAADNREVMGIAVEFVQPQATAFTLRKTSYSGACE